MLLEHLFKEKEVMDKTTTGMETEEPEKEQLYTVERILDYGHETGRLLFEL